MGDLSKPQTYITIDIKDELDKVILERNKKHFEKAKHTPQNKLPLNNLNSTSNFDLYQTSQGREIQLPENIDMETITVFEILKTLTKNTIKWL